VVVVDRYSERALRGILTDHVLLEEREDLTRLRQLEVGDRAAAGLGHALFDDLVAQLDALVADVHTGAGDELLDLLLTLPTERAFEQISAFTDACHARPPRAFGQAGS